MVAVMVAVNVAVNDPGSRRLKADALASIA